MNEDLLNIVFLGELSEFSVPLELAQFSVKSDPASKPLIVSLLIQKLQLKSVLGTSVRRGWAFFYLLYEEKNRG